MARQVGLCVAVTLALVGITLGLVFGGVFGVLGSAASGVTLGGVWAWQARQRDARVRKLVVTAYAAGVHQKALSALAEVLGTPDVIRARSAALKAEAELLAQRYANGDASDF